MVVEGLKRRQRKDVGFITLSKNRGLGIIAAQHKKTDNTEKIT